MIYDEYTTAADRYLYAILYRQYAFIQKETTRLSLYILFHLSLSLSLSLTVVIFDTQEHINGILYLVRTNRFELQPPQGKSGKFPDRKRRVRSGCSPEWERRQIGAILVWTLGGGLGGPRERSRVLLLLLCVS